MHYLVWLPFLYVALTLSGPQFPCAGPEEILLRRFCLSDVGYLLIMAEALTPLNEYLLSQ